MAWVVVYRKRPSGSTAQPSVEKPPGAAGDPASSVSLPVWEFLWNSLMPGEQELRSGTYRKVPDGSKIMQCTSATVGVGQVLPETEKATGVPGSALSCP